MQRPPSVLEFGGFCSSTVVLTTSRRDFEVAAI